MAVSFITIKGSNPTGLKNAFDAQMAVQQSATPTTRILGVELEAHDLLSVEGGEYNLFLTIDTSGPSLATPFLLQVSLLGSWSTVSSALQALITANPSYFFAPAKIAYLKQTRLINNFFGCQIYNVTAAAQNNYIPGKP